MRQSVLAALAVVVMIPACIGHRPPPAVPAQEQPTLTMPPTPPPTGHGRVVVDVVDGPSVVHIVDGTSVVAGGKSAVHLRRLCGTPCAVDLPYGQHELRFSVEGTRRIGATYVDIQGDTTYLRTALGEKTGGGPVAIIGGLATLLGVSFAAAGAVVWASDLENEDHLGRNFTLGSLAVAAVGIAMWYLDQPTVQRSASTQWR